MARVDVTVVCSSVPRPSPGASLIVQIRDTSLQDAPATVLGEARTTVTRGNDGLLARVLVSIPAITRHSTVWAHVDVDGDGRVSRGDYVTMQSYPLPPGPTIQVQVEVKAV